MIRAPDFLELASGWRHIEVCTVLPQDALPVPWTDPNGPREAVIALAFTASRRLYERKPTREQYVWLLGLFGCYPQWYRDAVPKEHFDIHCITP
ncbi:hypothetical protein DAEQUDRAFT_731094 [Daedalea quercina L-15889]|uniref:Uncharacterized protein n=1 Tax=Daedalea quercina L-15889 TaxID=1314783 RepID=A0A165MH36_9APHY|nr:hypothetical protein DAEQUDRAFT_731094 [Daedalea quercina L-15889]